MTITKRDTGGVFTIMVEGRLNTMTAPQLQAELISEFNSRHTIVLDFKELVYVSSAGLRVLIMGEKTAKAKGGKMTIINVSKEVMEIFEMTGFSAVLDIAV